MLVAVPRCEPGNFLVQHSPHVRFPEKQKSFLSLVISAIRTYLHDMIGIRFIAERDRVGCVFVYVYVCVCVCARFYVEIRQPKNQNVLLGCGRLS